MYGFLKFPVNLALLLCCCILLWVLQREKPGWGVSRFLASGKLSTALLGLFLAACLLMGLIPQSAEGEGLHCIRRTPWFIGIYIMLLTNLWCVEASRFGRKRLRFTLNHAGLFLAMAAGLAGVPDESVSRIRLERGAEGNMELLDFVAEYHDNGTPRHYEASVLIDGKVRKISVNHPFRRFPGDDLYLVDYDRSQPQAAWCTLERVRQPWKPVIWLGIVMMMLGSVLMFTQGAAKKK